MSDFLQQHRVDGKRPFSIAELPTDGKQFAESRDAAEAEFRTLRRELIDWQQKLYAEDKQKLLIVFQAMDAGGKDSGIRKLLRGVNPQGVRVTPFKAPSKEELAHDFLWRIHKAVPARGMIGVFNRSHYEDVLVVRVDNLVPERVWRPRYEQINQFENLLAASGTRILKFYLHISLDEQRERFQDRLDRPEKHWKFDIGDMGKRLQWYDYMAAYEEMMQRTSSDVAPWFAIPANQKWYRNLAISRIVVQTLREMNPQYPENSDDLSNVVIPDPTK